MFGLLHIDRSTPDAELNSAILWMRFFKGMNESFVLSGNPHILLVERSYLGRYAYDSCRWPTLTPCRLCDGHRLIGDQ
jgi:hypothetical protein